VGVAAAGVAQAPNQALQRTAGAGRLFEVQGSSGPPRLRSGNVLPLRFVRNMNSTHPRQNTMKPSIHTIICLLFLVVLLQGVANLWMTANHNAQLKAQTEVFNGQLKAQTEVHNTQLLAQAESFNAQLLARAAESQKK
jgi:hypothetical protein